MKYVIASHIAYTKNDKETFGPAHTIFEYLASHKRDVIFIKHCLEGRVQSSVATSKAEHTLQGGTGGNLLIRSWNHIRMDVKAAGKDGTFIGIDPINSLAGAWMKLMGRVKKNIYYTADYADKRFTNPVMDAVYHVLDRICLRLADEVWSVSTRIQRRRTAQGVPDNKNKLLPNSPDYTAVPRHTYDGNHNLVIVTHLSKYVDIATIFEIVSRVAKTHQDIRIDIVGTGPDEDMFKEMASGMKLGKHVRFHGQLGHDEALQVVSKSFIGFALYTDQNAWNRYGDSMKAREYVACGVPVIINEVPSTADDVKEYKAGLVVSKLDAAAIAKFVDRCITDKAYYAELRKNALSMAKRSDKSMLLNDLLELT